MKALLLVVVAGLAGAAPAVAGSGPIVDLPFQTPSTNIACFFASDPANPPTTLRCDIGSGIKPAQPRSSFCTLSRGAWNQGYSMEPTGRARQVCASDTVIDPNGQKLAYGSTWRRGGFTCSSLKVGLQCKNRSGHGFFLSRGNSYTF